MKTDLLIRWVQTSVAAAGIAGLAGCKEKAAPPAPTPPQVEFVVVEQKDVPIYRDWVGSLDGDVNATLSAQVSGYLLQRCYAEGSRVTNGQVLFQIDPAPFKADLAKAQAQLAQAQAQQEKYALNVKRYRPLAEKEAISQQELDDAVQNEKAAQAQVESAQAAVQQAQLNLNFTTIRSPLDGVAGLAQAQVGDLLSASSGPLTTVTKVEPMRAYFSVSQALMTELMQRRLAAGKKLDLREDTSDGVPLQLVLANGTVYPTNGTVRFKNNQVDVKTGTIRVVGEFANPQQLLVPGMFVRIRALLETQTNALVVPQRAVTDMQGRYLVAVVGAENKVTVLPVSVGERVGPQWVISGNVKAGDRIVAEGVQKVRDGSIVTPVPFVENTAAAQAVAPAPKAEEKKP